MLFKILSKQICKLFNCVNYDALEENKQLKTENIILKQKLADRQLIINRTNAFWKKKIAMISKENKGR